MSRPSHNNSIDVMKRRKEGYLKNPNITVKNIIEEFQKIEDSKSRCRNYYNAFVNYNNVGDFITNNVSKIMVFQFDDELPADKDSVCHDLANVIPLSNIDDIEFELVNIDNILKTLNDNDFNGKFNFIIRNGIGIFKLNLESIKRNIYYENDFEILRYYMNINEEGLDFKKEFKKDLNNVEILSKMKKEHINNIIDYFAIQAVYNDFIIKRKEMNNFIKVYENFDKEELDNIQNEPEFIKIKDNLSEIILNLIFGKKANTTITVSGIKSLISNNRLTPTFKISFLGETFHPLKMDKQENKLFSQYHIAILSYLYSIGKLEDLLYKLERYELSL